MCECIVSTYNRVWIKRVFLPILLVVNWTGKISISLSSFAPETLVAKGGLGRPVPRQSAHSPQLNLVLTRGNPPAFGDDVQI